MQIYVIIHKQLQPSHHSFIHSFHWHLQNLRNPCHSQELLPFLSVTYFFLPPFPTNYYSILSHPILPSISWSTSQSCCSPNSYTGCPRRNGQNFRRVFLMLKYTDITQNTYSQSWTVMEITAREVWKYDSCYTHTDYQIHIKTGRNMWFL